MKRIAVTGGAGFIGSHLIKVLLDNGNEVICLDNYFTGRRQNLSHVSGHPNLELIRHDVIEPILLEVDEIYHLACPASPVHYQYDPIKTAKTSFMGTMNMLGIAKRIQAKFLIASTSEVYGDPLVHPQVESYWGNVNPIGTRSCYDEGKRIAETLSMDYFRQHNVDSRIARIFNTYGPHMNLCDGRVVSNFIVQALQNQPIEVYGQGEQTRSFCYVSDLVSGLIKLMESEREETLTPCNLGNPNEMTILQLAHRVIDLTNSNSEIIYRPLPQDDPCRRQPNIERAKTKLNWEPVVSLDEGLKKTIPYFSEAIQDVDKNNPDFVKTHFEKWYLDLGRKITATQNV